MQEGTSDFQKSYHQIIKGAQTSVGQIDINEKIRLQIQTWSSHVYFDLLTPLFFVCDSTNSSSCYPFRIQRIAFKQENTTELKMLLSATAQRVFKNTSSILHHLIHHVTPGITLLILNHHLQKQCLFFNIDASVIAHGICYITKTFFQLVGIFSCFHISFFVLCVVNKENN